MAVERFLPSAIAHFEPADLIGALATGIVVLDADLCVVYANVAAQDLLAVSVNQARGKPFLSLVLEADSLQPLMRRALETGETLSEREMGVMTGPLGREHRVIDFTMTPLDSEFERKYLLLEIADATQPPDGSPAGARDQEPARRPARRGPTARARAARKPARIHRRDHQRGRPPDGAGRFDDRPGARAAKGADQHSRDLRTRVPPAAQ
jgi:PAS domain-containing protein